MADDHPNDEPQAEPTPADEPQEPEPDTWPVMRPETRTRDGDYEIRRG